MEDVHQSWRLVEKFKPMDKPLNLCMMLKIDFSDAIEYIIPLFSIPFSYLKELQNQDF